MRKLHRRRADKTKDLLQKGTTDSNTKDREVRFEQKASSYWRSVEKDENVK